MLQRRSRNFKSRRIMRDFTNSRLYKAKVRIKQTDPEQEYQMIYNLLCILRDKEERKAYGSTIQPWTVMFGLARNHQVRTTH